MIPEQITYNPRLQPFVREMVELRLTGIQRSELKKLVDEVCNRHPRHK